MNARAAGVVTAVEKSLAKGEWLTVMQIGCLWLIVKNNAQGANYFALMSRNASYIMKEWHPSKNLPRVIAAYNESVYDSQFFTEVPSRTYYTRVGRDYRDPWPMRGEQLDKCPFEESPPPRITTNWQDLRESPLSIEVKHQ